jgi:hypothetical protein
VTAPSTIKAVQLQLDTLADRVTAAERASEGARSGLSHHEDICGLRYEAIATAQKAQAETLTTIADGLKALDNKRSEDTRGIYNRFWWFAAGIGGGMFAIILALVAMLFKQ